MAGPESASIRPPLLGILISYGLAFTDLESKSAQKMSGTIAHKMPGRESQTVCHCNNIYSLEKTQRFLGYHHCRILFNRKEDVPRAP